MLPDGEDSFLTDLMGVFCILKFSNFTCNDLEYN